jgi:hypothetical protein
MRGVHIKDAELTQFDDETRQDHFYLRREDDCFYFIEYTSGKGYDYSEANGFISNLKKSPTLRGTFQWKHKERAINDAARTLSRKLPEGWRSKSTFVPVPPSDAKDDPEYDDRMTRVLKKLGVDVRELVYQKESMEPTHALEDRHTVQELVENYEIDEEQVEPTPTHLVIVDDMVTAGAHFRAMCIVLGNRLPGVPISGLFLARRVFAED